MFKKIIAITFLVFGLTTNLYAQDIFDDRSHLKGFIDKYQEVPKEILLEMIKDDTLTDFKTAAAVNVFKETYGPEVVSKEKKRVEKILVKRLKDTSSPFVQVEIIGTLIQIDRYKYFKAMVPLLISKLNHYNEVVTDMAYENLDEIIKNGNDRPREARIVFNTLRKVLFLSRKRLATIETPDQKLTNKLELVRWSIKVLGNEYLQKLPNEALNLL